MLLICIFQLLIKIKNYRINLVNDNMVKWSDTWYEKLDQSGIKFGKWVEKSYAFMRYADFVIVS